MVRTILHNNCQLTLDTFELFSFYGVTAEQEISIEIESRSFK